jgi:hypothetical protein
MRTLARLGCLSLAGVLAWGCDARRQSQLAVPTDVLENEAVVEVETATLRRGAVRQRISAPGSVKARRESRIGAAVFLTLLVVPVVYTLLDDAARALRSVAARGSCWLPRATTRAAERS